MNKVKGFILAAMILIVLPSVGMTAPGDLDITFNAPNGYVLYNGIPDDHDYANGVAIQPDGKIIVVGKSQDGQMSDAVILRYNGDGTLDTTFGTGGAVVYNGPANAMDTANAVAIQPNGKIVVVGTARNIDNYDVLVLRYNSNGTLDPTFGTSGVVLYNGPGNDIDNGQGVALQSDGKIIIVGESHNVSGGYSDSLLLRYNSNGTLDTTFGAGGAVFYDIGDGSDIGYAVAIQPDGKIVITGVHWSGSAATDLQVLRYANNGTLDATFGTGGVVRYGAANVSDAGHAVAVQPDGKILVVGNSLDTLATPIENEAVLLRYNSNGTPDSTFGSGGVVIYEDSSNQSPVDGKLSLALQPDGKIGIAGASYQTALSRYFAFVSFYNTDGTLFDGFGTSGFVLFSPSDQYASARAVALQADGKIVVAGTARMGTNTDVLTFRLFSNPPNQAPLCNASGAYNVECQGATTIVHLDGSGSSDPDPQDTLSYSWATDCPGGIFNDASSSMPRLTIDTSPGCSIGCSVTLTVSDGTLSSTCSSQVTINDTQDPVINCPSHDTIECDASTDPSNTGVATADDSCDTNPTVSYSDYESAGSCPDEKDILRTWTAHDDCGNSSFCRQGINVVDSTLPIITCPANVTLECDQSTDPTNTGKATATDNCDSDPVITYNDNITPGACQQEETITRTWTATDACGNANTCEQTIAVEDTKPPIITDISTSPSNLWPPTHKMVTISVAVTATDNCGVPVCSITSVTSNEPENGLGDGDTAPDWEINGGLTVNLRAERSGAGSGRVYTLTATCNDGCGNSSSGTVDVTVPHDKRK